MMIKKNDGSETSDCFAVSEQEAGDTIQASEREAARMDLTRDQALSNLMAAFERIWRDFWNKELSCSPLISSGLSPSHSWRGARLTCDAMASCEVIPDVEIRVPPESNMS